MQNRVLFVEEESELVEPRKLLEKAGFQVLNAQAPEQVFNLIHQAIPDVIVTDTALPSINGYELCKKLKAQDESRAIPLIVISDHKKMEDAYLYVGVQEFLVKPINPTDLSERISRQLNRNVSNSLRKCNVLVHNADPVASKKAKELLEANGHWAADTCENSSELLFKAMTHRPDIILVDLFMLDAAPEEVICALRSFSRFRKTVILTYYAAKPESEEDLSFQAKILEVRFMKEHCKEAGANAYIGPFSTETFVSLLSEYHIISTH